MKSKRICILLLLSLLGFTKTSFVISDYNFRVEDSKLVPGAIIHQLFEMVRKVIIDPFEFNYKETHLESGIFNIHANISDGSFLGLGTFELAQTDFDKSDLSIQLDINFPSLTLTADYYKMIGDVFHVVPLKGEGIIEIQLNDVRFCGKVFLKQSLNEKAILLDKFENARFTVAKVLSRTEFDNNIDEIFNEIIKDTLADYLTRFNGYIIQTFSTSFIEHFNSILQRYETWRFIVMLL